MAECTSDTHLENRPEATHRPAIDAASAVLTAPHQSDAATTSPGSNQRQDTAPPETAADRYAFYIFMGTIALAVLAMIVMALTI